MRAQVRGPVVAAWAQHLATAWADQPYASQVSLSDANLQVYGSNNGVPQAIIDAAAAPSTDEEAMEVQQLLAGDRQGYASTRTGSSEAAAAAAAAAADDMQCPTGTMTGLDDFELQLNLTPATEQMQQMAAAAQAVPNAVELLKKGGVLASCSGKASAGICDFDAHWPLLVHPGSFPHGVGQCPKGMSLEHWTKLLLSRYPYEQFAGNVPFMLHMFNILQRHQTLLHTKITLSSNRQAMDTVGSALPADVELVLSFIKAGGKGPVADRFYASASPAAKAMLQAYRVTGEQ